MIEDAARRFEPTFAIYERVVAAVGNIDTKMANLVIELLAVDMADNAHKNSNSLFCSPFQSVSKTLMCEDIMSSILPRCRITKIELRFFDIISQAG